MKGRTLVVFESRAGRELVTALERRGATTLWAPALAEEPDVDATAIARLIDDSERAPPALVVLQTAVGTSALFRATDALGATARWLSTLEASRVAVRGPKPVGELRRRGVRIDASAASPFATAELLEAIGRIPIEGQDVLVQRYGETNAELARGLATRGAHVVEIASYRWALPANREPLLHAIAEIRSGAVAATVFTSIAQVLNLLRIAREAGSDEALVAALNATTVASIGAVCSATLATAGIRVAVEANPPKLGPLVAALESALHG